MFLRQKNKILRMYRRGIFFLSVNVDVFFKLHDSFLQIFSLRIYILYIVFSISFFNEKSGKYDDGHYIVSCGKGSVSWD